MNLQRYFVELTYPRGTRQPAYFIEVEAVTKAEARLLAETQASREGWKGPTLKHTCRLVRTEISDSPAAQPLAEALGLPPETRLVDTPICSAMTLKGGRRSLEILHD